MPFLDDNILVSIAFINTLFVFLVVTIFMFRYFYLIVIFFNICAKICQKVRGETTIICQKKKGETRISCQKRSRRQFKFLV